MNSADTALNGFDVQNSKIHGDPSHER
jgi:hypothetical protein